MRARCGCLERQFHREQLQRVGYLPEERGLYKRMKVLDHLIFLGRLHGLSAEESRKRALDWCERLQIADWVQKKVEELSKGMQQKIQLVAALLHDPDLLILDEPFSGLDPANAVMVKDVMIELKKAGKTILFSTAPHGPGGAAVRFDLPDRPRSQRAGRRPEEDQGQLRKEHGADAVRGRGTV